VIRCDKKHSEFCNCSGTISVYYELGLPLVSMPCLQPQKNIATSSGPQRNYHLNFLYGSDDYV